VGRRAFAAAAWAVEGPATWRRQVRDKMEDACAGKRVFMARARPDGVLRGHRRVPPVLHARADTSVVNVGIDIAGGAIGAGIWMLVRR